MKKLVFVFFLTIVGFIGKAQLVQFTNQELEYFNGKQIFEYKGSLFCAGEVGGLFRSDDAGNTWYYASTKIDSFSNRIEQVAVNNQGLYGIVYGRVLKTYDMGKTWVNIMDSVTGLPNMNLDIRGIGATDQKFFLIATTHDWQNSTDSTFLYHSNNGYNWSTGPLLSTTTWDFKVMSIHNKKFFFRFNDNNNNDSLLYTIDGVNVYGVPFNGLNKNDIYFDEITAEENGNYLYVDYNGSPFRFDSASATWTNVRGSNFSPVAHVDMAFATDNLLFVFAFDLAASPLKLIYYKSHDHGNTWSVVNPGTGDYYVPRILFEVNYGRYLMGTQLGDMFLSTDTAKTWVSNTSGYQNSIASHFAIYDGTIITKKGEKGLVKSNDGGKTWSDANNGLPMFLSGLYFTQSVFSNLNRFFAIAEPTPDGDSLYLYQSTNKGQSWTRMTGLPSFKKFMSVGNVENQMIMQFWDEDPMFNQSEYYIFNGSSWIQLSKNFGTLNIVDVESFTGYGNDIFMFARENNQYQNFQIYYTNNQGTNWQQISLKHFYEMPRVSQWSYSPKLLVSLFDKENNKLFFFKRDRMYEREYDTLYELSNGQVKRVNTIGLPHSIDHNYMIKHDGYYYIGTSMGVYASRDAITWGKTNDTFYWGMDIANMQAIGNDIYLGTLGNGLWKQTHTKLEITGNNEVCQGDSVTLTASGTTNNLLWCCGYGTNPTISFLPTASKKVSATAVDNFNLSTSDTINLNVNPIPVADFTVNDSIQCFDNHEFSFTNKTTNGNSYVWDFGDGTQKTDINPKYTYTTFQDSFLVKLVATSDKGCMDSTYGLMYFNEAPVAEITLGGDSAFCDGGSVTLYANSGNYNYQWFKDDAIISGATDPFYIVTKTGDYSVDVTDKANGCSTMSGKVKITVHPSNFGISFSGSPRFFTSPPFNVAFDNFTPNPTNYNWEWYFGDNNTSTDFQPFHSYTYNGKFSVTLIAEDKITKCRDTAEQIDYVSCSGGSANPCDISPVLTYTGLPLICEGDSMLVQADTGWNYTYIWTLEGSILLDENKSFIYAKDKGEYRAFITNPACSLTSYPFTLSFYNSGKPQIEANGTIEPCSNDSMELFVSTFYYNYKWSTGETGSSIWVKNSGDYYVTITDGYGCKVKSNAFKVNASFLTPPEICLVLVDSAVQKNLIVWEREQSNQILGYNVYKETYQADVYNNIGYVPYDSLSVFLDTMSSPKVRANRYKLTMIDTCGTESAPSQHHKTIHLSANEGVNDENNLIWSHYEGFPFSYYRIYRGTMPSNLTLLDSIPSNLNSYTDVTPPAGLVFYMVTVQKPDTCYPAVLRAYTNSGPFSQSLSNLKDYTGKQVYLQVLPDAHTFKQSGGSTVFTVFTSLDNWQAVSSESWLSITTDQNTDKIMATATENTTGVDRNAIITVSGTGVADFEVNITQIGVSAIDEANNLAMLIMYPNPFEDYLNIEYELTENSQVKIEVYNALGKRICVLADENQMSGMHQTVFKAGNYGLAGGFYYVRFTVNNKTFTKKVVGVE